MLIPGYYSRFRCLADRCPDNCCHGWAVPVDASSAARYRGLSGPQWEGLRRNLREEDGQILLQNHGGRCPMQESTGLCRIQAALGEEALCRTCRDYPRLRHEYPGFTEGDLDLGCPEAARLILISPEPPAQPETDDPVLALLISSRIKADQILTAYPLGDALCVLLFYGCHLQAILDGDDPGAFDEKAALLDARLLAKNGNLNALLSFFAGLDILDSRWRERLSSPAPDAWQESHRALSRYLVRRFWLQTASDGDLYARVKLIVVSTLVIRALGKDAAFRYAREVFSDPENLEALLTAAYSEPAMTDERLLALLQGGMEGL